MIKYNDSDWVKLEDEAQLSEGEFYIVYQVDTMYGVMEYDTGELWGDDIKLVMKERTNLKPLRERGYWIMPFEYPEPPKNRNLYR